MAKKAKGPTFSELLKQPTWSEAEARVSGEHAVRPGKYNAAGELFDPSGRPILLQQEFVTPELAQELVERGRAGRSRGLRLWRLDGVPARVAVAGGFDAAAIGPRAGPG